MVKVGLLSWTNVVKNTYFQMCFLWHRKNVPPKTCYVQDMPKTPKNHPNWQISPGPPAGPTSDCPQIHPFSSPPCKPSLRIRTIYLLNPPLALDYLVYLGGGGGGILAPLWPRQGGRGGGAEGVDSLPEGWVPLLG